MTTHDIDAALLSEARIVAAYLIFFGSYFVFALGKFPWMQIRFGEFLRIGVIPTNAGSSGYSCSCP